MYRPLLSPLRFRVIVMPHYHVRTIIIIMIIMIIIIMWLMISSSSIDPPCLRRGDTRHAMARLPSDRTMTCRACPTRGKVGIVVVVTGDGQINSSISNKTKVEAVEAIDTIPVRQGGVPYAL